MRPDRHATSLRQIVSHAREAVDMAEGRTRSDLSSDRMPELSLVRLVEVVGEAASRVSEWTRLQFPTVPWRVVVAMRDHLIHGYDTVIWMCCGPR